MRNTVKLSRSMFEVIKAEAVRKNIKEIAAATTIDKLRFMFTVAYMMLILYSTVFSRTPGNERIFTGLFWEYRNGVWIDAFLNIAFFIPLGILIGKLRFLYRASIFSAVLEGVQFVGKLGYCQLDDVLHNTVGFCVGCLIVHLLIRKSSRAYEVFSMLYRDKLKRFFDFMIALIASPFVLILIVIMAPIIVLNDHGPVFYNAERRGLHGKKFKMYKFRSMYVNSPDLRNADGSTYNSAHDPRVTPVGRFMRKTSLDEIPQILNVLKGDMSFVGPRPTLAQKPFEQIPEHDRIRYRVRPGITGYAQAYFRNSISQSEKYEQDNYYVDHVSFWLDIKILFKTVISVIKHDNVFVENSRK